MRVQRKHQLASGCEGNRGCFKEEMAFSLVLEDTLDDKNKER